MKIEKLELLLNKVVEFNQPDVAYYKGFLYKDYRGYYIKVVESILGSFLPNNKIWLKDGDEQYIIQADKPKLMRVSLRSWHYRLVKFVLGENAPTPKTMQNGCPYFWLLIFSLFAFSFVVLWQAIKSSFMLIPQALVWGLEKLTENWVVSVNDEQAYEILWNGKYSEFAKMPVTAKMYFDKTDNEFFDYFMLEKYKIDSKLNPDEYDAKKRELFQKWEAWRKEIQNARDKKSAEAHKRMIEFERKNEERDRKRAINKAKWDDRMKPIEDGLKKLFISIYDTFSFNYNWKVLIKRTKQVVGALITAVLLAATYFVVNGLAGILMLLSDFLIANWQYIAIIGVLLVICGIIYVLYILFSGWLQSVVNKYNMGKRVWYIEPIRFTAVYLIYYPIKYVIFGLFYALFYILWIPIKFIFHTCIWKVVLVNFGKYSWKALCAFGRGLANSTGVFGEYFSASYTDYCPGIEWVDAENDEE